jgi:uncharacterized membrane protein (GlpM family)
MATTVTLIGVVFSLVVTGLTIAYAADTKDKVPDNLKKLNQATLWMNVIYLVFLVIAFFQLMTMMKALRGQ